MKHDISRNTFNPRKHFSRVLKQQGRVDLEADWNEQASIVLHYLRTLATDLIGPHGGPEQQCGFEIIDAKRASKIAELKGKEIKAAGFFIGPGRYYVDGLLCENEKYEPFLHQPDDPLGEADRPEKLAGKCLAYLDVWERLITAAEDPDIREVALGGPDTAARSKVVWQVRLKIFDAANRAAAEAELEKKRRVLPRLRAELKPGTPSEDACILAPDSRFRGAENQLYRVEIHQGNEAGQKPTFKWSRDNGAVVFPVIEAPETKGNQLAVRVAHLGPDSHFGLAKDDWVELADDASVLRGQHQGLFQVHDIVREDSTVILSGTTSFPVDPAKHAILRRWDHRAHGAADGALLAETGVWLPLEDGVQIQFDLSNGAEFRTGDYWLIPARTTGVVEWPRTGEPKQAEFLPPRGIVHHYAPLAAITVDGDGAVTFGDDFRRAFIPVKDLGSKIQPPGQNFGQEWPE